MTTIHRVDLDPALVDKGTYASRYRRRLVDVAFLLCTTVALALLLPAGLSVPQLTDLGRPTTLVALMLAGIWIGSRLNHRLVTPGPQPMRWAATILFTAVLCSYAAGLLRGMPTIESNGADREILNTLAFLGPILAFADGVPSRRRLDTVIYAVVVCGGLMGLMGIGQSFGMDATAYIRFPGLDNLGDFNEPWYRGNYARVASTAAHYIEFSAIMALLLPFGVYVARYAHSRAMRQVGAICAVIMFAVIPMTLSRTGVVALGVVLVVMLPMLPGRQQLSAVVAIIGMTGALMVARPSMLGSVLGMFTSWNNDPSVQGREDDYKVVSFYFEQHPWFGRGQGTFIPTIYTFLDNSWLGYIVSGGIVGVTALVLLHLTAIGVAITAFRRATDAADRYLCMCLICAQIVAMLVAGTFDAMAFNSYTTMLAVLTGCAGAIWRLLHREREVRTIGSSRAD